MPRGDRTGPMGYGPMTGRGAGYCAGYGMPGYANPIPGRGYGRRGGFGGHGRGWRHGFYASGMPGWARFGWVGPQYAAPYPPVVDPTAGEETDVLREQAEYLKEALADVEKRLSELESGGGE
jgi:hypothetical protein